MIRKECLKAFSMKQSPPFNITTSLANLQKRLATTDVKKYARLIGRLYSIIRSITSNVKLKINELILERSGCTVPDNRKATLTMNFYPDLFYQRFSANITLGKLRKELII